MKAVQFVLFCFFLSVTQRGWNRIRYAWFLTHFFWRLWEGVFCHFNAVSLILGPIKENGEFLSFHSFQPLYSSKFLKCFTPRCSSHNSTDQSWNHHEALRAVGVVKSIPIHCFLFPSTVRSQWCSVPWRSPQQVLPMPGSWAEWDLFPQRILLSCARLFRALPLNGSKGSILVDDPLHGWYRFFFFF